MKMTDEGEAKRIDAQAQVDLEAEVKASLLPLREGEFSAKIDKILVYTQSAVRSKDAKARDNFIRFAHLNLDAILVQALESLVFRPRLASKSDEQKKAAALQKTFDRLEHPEKALLEHYVCQLGSSQQVPGGRALGAPILAEEGRRYGGVRGF